MDNRSVCLILLLLCSVAIIGTTGHIITDKEKPDLNILSSKDISLYYEETNSKMEGVILLEGDSQVRHVVICVNYSLSESDISPIYFKSNITPENPHFCGTCNGKPTTDFFYYNTDYLGVLWMRTHFPEDSGGNLIYEFDVSPEEYNELIIEIDFGTHYNESGIRQTGVLKEELIFDLEGD